MEKPNGKRKLIQRLKDRYRLVVLNESTLEDKWYIVLSRINILVWISFIGFLLVALGIVLVSFTPLREYIPGYPDGNVRRMFMLNTFMVDSLENQLRVRDQYIQNIDLILKGKETNSYFKDSDSIPKYSDVNVAKPEFDSVLLDQIVEEDRYNIGTVTNNSPALGFEISKIHFFCPLRGAITNNFDAQGSHFGIDIVSNLNEPVLSVLGGTVVFEGWTLEAGYVVEVQHNNDLISLYKHNSQLLKKMGDRVVAGEPIAIIGNTGEYTTGPHLHFELWHMGKPLNPADYIVF